MIIQFVDFLLQTFPLRAYGAQLAQSLPELAQSFLEKKIKKEVFISLFKGKYTQS